MLLAEAFQLIEQLKESGMIPNVFIKMLFKKVLIIIQNKNHKSCLNHLSGFTGGNMTIHKTRS